MCLCVRACVCMEGGRDPTAALPSGTLTCQCKSELRELAQTRSPGSPGSSLFLPPHSLCPSLRRRFFIQALLKWAQKILLDPKHLVRLMPVRSR